MPNYDYECPGEGVAINRAVGEVRRLQGEIELAVAVILYTPSAGAVKVTL